MLLPCYQVDRLSGKSVQIKKQKNTLPTVAASFWQTTLNMG
jgi:hypothetical protein